MRLGLQHPMGGPTTARRRGTIIVYMLIVLTVVITGLIVTMGVAGGTQVQVASLTFHRDQAFYAAEAGIQHAFWQVEYNNWIARGYPALSGSTESGSYRVTVTLNGWNSPVTVQAVGTAASNPQAQCTIHASLGQRYKIPAVSLGGDFSGGGGVHVTGDIYTRGAITQHGNFTVYGGNIFATNTIRSGVSYDTGYTGHPGTPDVPAPPDVLAIANALRATAGAVQATDPDNLVFPASGILYYLGDFYQGSKKASITGDGTLVVFGNVDIKKADCFVGHQVNIVCTGTFTTEGGSKFNLAGSVYAHGAISSQSQFAVQGVIVSEAGLDTQGQGGDVSILPVPAWDPRLTAASQGTHQVTSFTGPIF